MQAIADSPVYRDSRLSTAVSATGTTVSTPSDEARALLAVSGMESRWRMWVANLLNGRAVVPSGTPLIP